MNNHEQTRKSHLSIKKVNLHIHTRYSDGAFKPKQVIERAIQHELDIISLTDHDTVDAYKHIPKSHLNIRILPGIELSSAWKDDDVHVLGYGIDIENKRLLDVLNWMKDGRRKRAEKMLSKLSILGIKIPVELVLSYAGDMKLIVRPHIAQALIANKHCKTKQEAFDKYIGNDAPAYVPKPELSTEEIIRIIHEAEGAAVIAHPMKLKSQDFLEDFINLKIDGIEVWHPDHNNSMISEYEAFCKLNNLIMTGGSDFHGEKDIDNFIGSVPVSETAIADIHDLWYKYKSQSR